MKTHTSNNHRLYDIYINDVKLNTSTPPMTEKEADNYIGIVQITYGYKPEKVPTTDN